MNIYLMTVKGGSKGGTDTAVVVAPDEETAQKYSPKTTEVFCLGKARQETSPGVLASSFIWRD